MGFFTLKQKRMARKCSMRELVAGYDNSDFELERASYNGDKKALKQAMKKHQKYEYALLYRNTPQFKKKHKNN